MQVIESKSTKDVYGAWPHCCHHHHHHLLLFFFPSLLSRCSQADDFSLSFPSAVMSLACHRPTNNEASPPKTTNPKNGEPNPISIFF